MRKSFGLVVLGGLLAVGTPTPAHEAHVHGVAHMNVTVDGNEVEIELETPLANVLSFEHAPETEAQKEEVRAMAARLRKAEDLFILPVEAQCGLKNVSLESEVLDDALLSPAGSREAEKAHAQKHASDGDKHAEQEHGGHEHGEHGHADLDMDVSFFCRNPEKLNSLRVDLFRSFAGLHEVEVQMITPRGQRAAELTPESNMLRW